jgi:hypothetical protein
LIAIGTDVAAPVMSVRPIVSEAIVSLGFFGFGFFLALALLARFLAFLPVLASLLLARQPGQCAESGARCAGFGALPSDYCANWIGPSR